jgi:DNA-binding NtrC family response regulator
VAWPGTVREDSRFVSAWIRSKPVAKPHKFLIVDLHRDGLTLLERTLSRKFPDATIIACTHANEALRAAADPELDAAIVHRPVAETGEEMVRQLRKLQPRIPIIMVSSIDRSASAQAAGATKFLPYDGWLRLGAEVEEALDEEKRARK